MEIDIELEKYQSNFFLSKAMFPAMVSAWGTGKTMLGILKGMAKSEKYKNNLGIIFRKEWTDLRDSTCVDFKNLTGLHINSARECVLANGSKILFRHIEELNNIQNINLGWFLIEQGEELETDDEFFTLFGRLRRANCGTPQGMVIANTKGHNWIWKLWKMQGLKNTLEELPEEMREMMKKKGIEICSLSEATTYDNKNNLPETFLMKVEIMKQKKPKLYNRFVMNSWEDDDIEDVAIQRSDVETARTRKIVKPLEVKVVGCDPARFGDDETVIYCTEDTDIKDDEITRKKNTMDTAARIHRMAIKHEAKVAVIEVAGLAGAGIVDRVRELAWDLYDVIEVNPAERKPEIVGQEHYNMRSHLWLQAGESFANEEISLTWDDDILREELTTPKYSFRNARQYVESKDEIKKRIGRSPDRATAYLLCLHGLPYAAEIKKREKKKKGSSWEDYWGKRKSGSSMSA